MKHLFRKIPRGFSRTLWHLHPEPPHPHHSQQLHQLLREPHLRKAHSQHEGRQGEGAGEGAVQAESHEVPQRNCLRKARQTQVKESHQTIVRPLVNPTFHSFGQTAPPTRMTLFILLSTLNLPNTEP